MEKRYKLVDERMLDCNPEVVRHTFARHNDELRSDDEAEFVFKTKTRSNQITKTNNRSDVARQSKKKSKIEMKRHERPIKWIKW